MPIYYREVISVLRFGNSKLASLALRRCRRLASAPGAARLVFWLPAKNIFSIPGQDRLGRVKMCQDVSRWVRTGQDMSEQERTERDRKGGDSSGQVRTGQDMIGQGKIRQDSLELLNLFSFV